MQQNNQGNKMAAGANQILAFVFVVSCTNNDTLPYLYKYIHTYLYTHTHTVYTNLDSIIFTH